MSGPKKNMLDELRQKINQQLPSRPSPAASEPAPAPAKEPEPAPPVVKHKPAAERPAKAALPRQKTVVPTRTGRGMQLYLDDTDRKIITNLAVWFGSQEKRLSDSQVVKAAIRFAEGQGRVRLLQIADDVKKSDRRHLTADQKKALRRG
jgi:hypothetical protein